MTIDKTIADLRRIAAQKPRYRGAVAPGYHMLADGRVLPARLARSIAAREAWRRRKDKRSNHAPEGAS